MVILFDIFNLPDSIYEIVFSTKQQMIVAKVLVRMIKEAGGEINKTQMSWIANKLHEGNLVTELDEPGYKGKQVKLSYNKRQFYDRILTPMKAMGMIHYDLYKKTYRMTDRFSKEMQSVGILWKQEVQKSVQSKSWG